MLQWLKKMRFCLLALSFCLLVLNFFIQNRQVVFLDEQFSFAHANSTQGAFMSPEINTFMSYHDGDKFYGKWLDTQDFRNYLTSQENENFKYQHVSQNLKNDVHPPLYFWILHWLCSFFPDQFILQIPLLLNLVLFALGFVFLYNLAKKFTQNELVALTVPLLWGLSSGGMLTVLFARMYMLQTLCLLALCMEILCLFQVKSLSFFSAIRMIVWMCVALLTQYNSLVYIGVIVGGSFSLLIFYKNYKLALKLSVLFIVSLLLSIAVFPEAIEVLFHSHRGVEATHKILYEWCNPLFLIGIFYRLGHLWWNDLLGVSALPFSAYILCLGFGGIYFFQPHKNKILFCMTLAVVVLGVVLAFLMPFMYDFDARYFAPLLPFLALLSVLALEFCLRKLNLSAGRQKFIFVCFLLLACSSGIEQAQTIFLRNENVKNQEFLEQVNKKTVFVVEDYNILLFYERLFYLQHAKRVFNNRLDACSPSFLQQIDRHSGDFVLVLNGEDKHHNGYDFTYRFPDKAAPLCSPLLQKLKFVGFVRLGERFYDWYEIQKNI